MENSPFFTDIAKQVEIQDAWMSVTDVASDRVVLSRGLSGAHFAHEPTARDMAASAVSPADARRAADNRSRTLKTWKVQLDTFPMSLQADSDPIQVAVRYIPLRCEECEDRCAVLLLITTPVAAFHC